jgi:arginyl-tRNA synthetase
MSVKDNIVLCIKNKIISGAAKAFENTAVPDFIIETPKEKSHGDFSSNIAMLLTKQLRRSPAEIAKAIIENLERDDLIQKAEVAGPGFINFYLSHSWIYEILEKIEKEGDGYGSTNRAKGKKVMIEFISANPTGPMHMGNARGGAIGDSLAAAFEGIGAEVTREFYVNDSGAQIEKFGRSLEARYIELLTGEENFPEDGYRGEDIKEHARDYIDLYGDGLLSESSEDRRKKLADYALDINLDRLRADLSKYKINYDVWFMESGLYKSGEVEDTVSALRESGFAYENEGATWFKSTEFGSEKDDVLVRANGIPTYFAADIAYHRNKFVKRGFDKVINVWGADHHGHIARMKGAMQALGIDPEKLHVVTMQLVRLVENGETVRMSKRTGKMITLSDLLDDIGVDAARFFFNLRQAGSHFEFDLGLAVEQSNENPVFYVQYAYARICSIIRLLAQEGITEKPYEQINTSLLEDEREIDLIKKLGDLPGEIILAAESFEPSRLTRYALDTAALFHSFYNACQVRGAGDELLAARLKLVCAVKTVLGNVLRMLGVTAPERM